MCSKKQDDNERCTGKCLIEIDRGYSSQYYRSIFTQRLRKTAKPLTLFEAGCKQLHRNVQQYLAVCMHFGSIWMLSHGVTNDLDECKFAVLVSCRVKDTGRGNKTVSQLQYVSIRANHKIDNEEWKQLQCF
jgi:hypothetical protein